MNSGKAGAQDALRQEALELLEKARGSASSRAELVRLSIALSRVLLRLANGNQTAEERRRSELLARMMRDRPGQVFTQALTDRVHRPHRSSRVIRELTELLATCGAPRYLGMTERALLWTAASVGKLTPGIVAPAIARRIRRETAAYVIPEESADLDRYLDTRSLEGIRVNLNRLGEEVLSEAEAERHVAGYVEVLGWAKVDTISIKISSICSQLNLLAYDATLELLKARLRVIYRAALSNPRSAQTAAGTNDTTNPVRSEAKLVYLDMEAYRDLHLTLDLFTSVLDEDEFLALSAGVVLQAYVPDSALLQQGLVAWSQKRVARGGAAIRLRIVKGANLALERVDSALRGQPLPTYARKLDADANYKRMVEYGTEPEAAAAVTLGIASHNLFDLAYAAILRSAKGVERSVGFELLEGMANPLCRALNQVTGDILLYAPMVKERDFTSAVAYLARRLDENTAPENFLYNSFGLQAEGPSFERETQRFVDALQALATTPTAPRRPEQRSFERPPSAEQGSAAEARHSLARGQTPFINEPDTDFSRVGNRRLLALELNAWKSASALRLPLHIAGRELVHDSWSAGFDPSRPGHTPYYFTQATAAEVEASIAAAAAGLPSWSATPVLARQNILFNVADELRKARWELIACMVLDAGKRVEEADAEVSEAIDFAEYYARQIADLSTFTAVHLKARGVTVVTPPWNFPLAIPLGGVFAALAAGNTVILKPAPETVLVLERAARILWRAGVPETALCFVSAEDEVATRFITDPRIATVVLTGATATAKLFCSLRPGLHLCAETGGKNAIIVSDCADHDLAIRDTLASAFGHAGQKCSAASLLIVERPLYESPDFLRKLGEAAASLAVGSAWDPVSFVTPLIAEPSVQLRRALTELDAGESWLLEPQVAAENPRLWSPGIKLGVRPGSTSHTTEFFGPVLSVLCARDLKHAVELANQTPYGLTAGLHSLSIAEQTYFLEHMDAGNLYVNRGITGAIVGRQPFGGRKASSFGPGLKAGGPNYVYQLTHPENVRPAAKAADVELPAAFEKLVKEYATCLPGAEAADLLTVSANYYRAYHEHFSTKVDPFRLLGQDNLLRYEPVRTLIVLDATSSTFDFACSLLAAHLCQSPIWLMCAQRLPPRLDRLKRQARLPQINVGADVAAVLRAKGILRLRSLADDKALAAQIALPVEFQQLTGRALFEGRFELLCYLREQSQSINYHRYGNLGARKPE